MQVGYLGLFPKIGSGRASLKINFRASGRVGPFKNCSFGLLKARVASNVYGMTALQLACNEEKPSIQVLDILLQINGIDVNFVCSIGWTALHHACRYGHTEVVKRLCADTRIDVNMRDSEGKTPLHLVAREGYCEIVKILLSFLA